MAAAKKRDGARAGEPESIGRKLAVAEMKIECLRGLGLRTRGLDELLEKAKNALREEGPGPAGERADSLLVLFSLAAVELEGLVERFLGKPGASQSAASPGGKTPSVGEIEETVSEAFRKALHSSALRRMVEVVAVEKIRSVLNDDGLPASWIEGAVRKALEDIRAGGEVGRKKA